MNTVPAAGTALRPSSASIPALRILSTVSYTHLRAHEIEDHSAYLLNARNGSRKRYAGLTDTKSYKRQLQIIKNGGYATSGSYVSQLSRVINTYNLTQWDK